MSRTRGLDVHLMTVSDEECSQASILMAADHWAGIDIKYIAIFICQSAHHSSQAKSVFLREKLSDVFQLIIFLMGVHQYTKSMKAGCSLTSPHPPQHTSDGEDYF